MTKIDFSRIAEDLQEEALLVSNTLREKGAQHFMRPLVVVGFVLYASYAFVYLRPVKKLRQLDVQLAAAKATAQYAQTYKSYQDRLLELYPELPLFKDRDQWLFNSLIDSMKAENIVSDSLRPPVEDETGGLIYQSVGMNSTLKYSEFLSWLSRIEGAKPMLHVSAINISKKTDSLGQNQVSCMISTVIPKNRFAP